MIYMQVLNKAQSIGELRTARSTYKDQHGATESNHDEYGGMLRVAGYRLRGVPIIGGWLEDKVRQDDAVMAQAAFTYPPDCTRYAAPIERLDDVIS